MIEIQTKKNLLGMPKKALAEYFFEIGEKKFRAEQVMRWIYHRNIIDFQLMTDLTIGLRNKLSLIAEIVVPEIVRTSESNDGTCKWIVRVASGSLVEMVFIPEDRRGTLCVSSQAGCALDCSFCSTGRQGFNSDLRSDEIIGQVWQAANFLLGKVSSSQCNHITNIVMMGMGEPLLNFDNVMDSMDVMLDDYGYGISKRKVTLSTSGVVSGLQKMIGRTTVSLALSLHASNDELRNELVPINRKYPLRVLFKAVKEYIDSLSDKRRVVTIEYILLKGINDQMKHADELACLLRNVPCKINLIPFNTFPCSGYERPSNTAITRFRVALQDKEFNTTVRKTRGSDILAACGQLAGEIVDRTHRSGRYRSAGMLPVNSYEPIKILESVS